MITFCLSFSLRTYTMQSLSLLKRLFTCTPTTSPLLWAPPTCSLTKSHVRLSAAVSSSPQPRRVTRSATTASPHTSPLCLPDSGESVQVRSKESVQKEASYLSPQEHKRFKHGREVTPAAQLQYLKPQLCAQALARHKLVFTLPKRVNDRRPTGQGQEREHHQADSRGVQRITVRILLSSQLHM